MESQELKDARKIIKVDQKKMADLLGVAMRTYQNWEQSEESKNHRQIPKETAEKVRSLVLLRKSSEHSYIPEKIVWLSVPLLPQEINYLKNKARRTGLETPIDVIRHLITSSD